MVGWFQQDDIFFEARIHINKHEWKSDNELGTMETEAQVVEPCLGKVK